MYGITEETDEENPFLTEEEGRPSLPPRQPALEPNQVHLDIDDVSGKVHDTIEKLLNRGENINALRGRAGFTIDSRQSLWRERGKSSKRQASSSIMLYGGNHCRYHCI